MAERNRGKPDEIGTPDPDNEPRPPKIDSAGKLGKVGEQKREVESSEEKKGIWPNRPPPLDDDPESPAGG